MQRLLNARLPLLTHKQCSLNHYLPVLVPCSQAATNGNSERKARNTQPQSQVPFVRHTQSAALSPPETTFMHGFPLRQALRARQLPKCVCGGVLGSCLTPAHMRLPVTSQWLCCCSALCLLRQRALA